MLRVGMIKQSSAGIYSWLPLGFKVMKKIEQIVREEQNKIGAQEILMPTIQPSDIWKESGRYDDYGDEMLRIKELALKKNSFSAAVNAETNRGKAGGLYIDRKIIKHGKLEDLTEDQLIMKMAQIQEDYASLLTDDAEVVDVIEDQSASSESSN